jgi:predicted acetyltransferase
MTFSPTGEDLPAPPLTLAAGEVSLRFVRVVPGEPARGLVPFYHFRILAADGTDVGHINFRVGESEHVRVAAGHIGYQIGEAFRGHRYALQACRAIAPFVAAVYEAVLITCDPDNQPSRRTIERLGARFMDEVAVPPHDPQYQRGARYKRRYQWRPAAV